MPKAKGMTDFMSANIADQFASKFIGKWDLFRTVILRRALDEIPHLRKFDDIVPENDMRGNDFATSRIMNMRPHGVGNGFSNPTDDRISGIFGIKVWIFSFGGCIFANNGIFETCFFKSGGPIFNTLLHSGAPFLWDLFRKIINDRLDDFTHLSSWILFF